MSKLPTAVMVALIVCATVLGVAVVAALTLAVLKAPEGTDLPALIAACAAAVVAIGTGAANLLKLRGVEQSVTYLANGGTDAKVRAGVADVIDPRYLKPDVHEQLERDRQHREASPAYKGEAGTPGSSSMPAAPQ